MALEHKGGDYPFMAMPTSIAHDMVHFRPSRVGGLRDEPCGRGR